MKVAVGTVSYFVNREVFASFKASITTLKDNAPKGIIWLNVINKCPVPEEYYWLKHNFDWVANTPYNNVSLAWNMLILEARNRGCNRLIITNSDVMYSPSALKVWISYAKECDDYITGAQLYTTDEMVFPIDNKDVWYCAFMINLDRFEEFQQKDPDTREEVRGYFDYKRYDPAYYEDIDYQLRVNGANMGSSVCKAAKCYHVGSQTKKLDPSTEREIALYYPRILQKHIEKWGGTLGQKTYKIPFDRNSY